MNFLQNLSQGIPLTLIYGALGIIFLVGGYYLFDIIERRIDFAKELKNNNIAVGIVIAGFLVALGLIIASAIS